MSENERPTNIHEAISAVMAEIGYVQKESAPQLRYTFASERALIAALRPVMVKHGIFCYVADLPRIDRGAFTTKGGTPMNETLTHGIVRFVHAPTNSSIDVHATGEGMDAGDKSANKASTGLLKYALRQTFLIETGDDPDYTPSDEQERDVYLSTPVPAGRMDNQWEQGILDKLIDLGFTTQKRHLVARLNKSMKLKAVPYGELIPEVAAGWMIAYERSRKSDAKAGVEVHALAADVAFDEDLIAEAREMLGQQEAP